MSRVCDRKRKKEKRRRRRDIDKKINEKGEVDKLKQNADKIENDNLKQEAVRLKFIIGTLTTTSVVRDARPRTKCSRALKVPTPSAFGRKKEVEKS